MQVSNHIVSQIHVLLDWIHKAKFRNDTRKRFIYIEMLAPTIEGNDHVVRPSDVTKDINSYSCNLLYLYTVCRSKSR